MQIPGPRDTLADCRWLPRIIAKGRMLRAGTLPPEYAARFGVPDGVDGVFLPFWGVTKDDVIAASAGSDEQVAAWFLALPGVSPARIAEWNHLAENLGRPGFPLEARMPVGLATKYRHVAPRKPTCVFEMLEMDEGLR